MKRLLIILSIVGFAGCNAENDVSPGSSDTFIKLFGASNSDIAYKAMETTDGGFIILGTTEIDPTNPIFKIRLIKTDAFGNELELNRKFFPDDTEDYSLVGRSIIELADGYLIVGDSIKNEQEPTENQVRSGLYLLRTDLNGGEVAHASLSITDADLNGQDVIMNSNGEYVVVSNLTGDNITNDIHLTTYNADLSLNPDCSRQYPGGNIELVKSLHQDINNDFVFGGTVKSFFGSDDSDNSRVLKIPGDCRASLVSGPLLVESTNGNYTTHQVIPALSGFVLVGTTDDTDDGDKDIFMARVDENGAPLGSPIKFPTIPGEDLGGDEEGFTIATTSDGGFVIGGSTLSNTAGETDILIFKTDVLGNVKWARKYGDLNEEQATYIQQTSDGGFMILGNTEFGGVDTIILIKTDSQGNVN